MPSRDSHSAKSARRRRHLVIRQVATAQDRFEWTPPEPSKWRSFVAGCETSAAEDVGPPLNAVTILPAEDETQETADLTPFQRCVRSAAGLTWVIAGDSLESDVSHGRDWRSFSGRLTDHVRNTLGRRDDVFIVHTAPDRRVAAVDGDAPRLLRFQPDVVLLSIGPREADAGKRGLLAFERYLTALITSLAAASVTLVLTTPPLTPAEDGTSVVQLIYVEAIRALAAEYDVDLIDHFAHWETAATSIGGLERWFEAESTQPGRIGHEQLARRTISDLRLDPAVIARSCG